MQNFNILKIFKRPYVLFVIFTSTFFCNYIIADIPKNSISQTLDLYGYSTIEQKKAIEDLMHFAKIIPDNQSLNDYYPIRNTHTELLSDILSFVKELQNKFVLRSGKQERWEVQPQSWMGSYKTEIMNASKELGLVDTVYPKINTVDAICILGATTQTMEKRINYAVSLLNGGELSAKYIILLAGERYVTIGIDGTEQELLDIAKKYQITDISKLTETHLIKYIYENSIILKPINLIVIDTPRGNLSRPTTQTTMLELISWLREHKDINKMIFVSSQPTVNYQRAIIEQVFENSNYKIHYEVVGPSVSSDFNSIDLLEAFGSYIWAKTPKIISDLHPDIIDENLINEFEELYSKSPLIYSSVKSLFKSKIKN